jgi:septal ring factor EnvC (AmiA/AmiB activator)
VFDEKKELHETLKDLKTKHDSLKEQCVKKEKQIVRMQDMIKTIKTEDETLKKEEVDLSLAVDESRIKL